MSVWAVFSNNNLIGSKTISYGSIEDVFPNKATLEDVPSHFLYVFKEAFVLESRMTEGVRADEWEHFKTKNKIIAVFDVTKKIEEKHVKWYYFYKTLYRTVLNKDYDKKAILFLAKVQFFWKFFGKTKPKENKCNDPNKYFCLEIAKDISDQNLAISTPLELMEYCAKKYKRIF